MEIDTDIWGVVEQGTVQYGYSLRDKEDREWRWLRPGKPMDQGGKLGDLRCLNEPRRQVPACMLY